MACVAPFTRALFRWHGPSARIRKIVQVAEAGASSIGLPSRPAPSAISVLVRGKGGQDVGLPARVS